MLHLMPFDGDPLDRVSNERHDDAWVQEKLRDSASRFLPLWRLQAPVVNGDEPRLVWTDGRVLNQLGDGHQTALLGLLDGVAHFAVDVSELEDPIATLDLEDASYSDVRALATRVPAPEAGTIAHARSVLDWHRRHGFCPNCGSKTESFEGGSVRKCAACSASHFPRTDPVVIMLVWRGDRCLLGKRAGAAGNRYSCLAGYMDQGETIEAAVRREVREEAGLEIDEVRYFASQPWPFPSTLMIGCFAHAASDDIEVDAREIEDARWFSRDEISRVLGGPDPAVEVTIPERVAIAHHLIRAWSESGPAGAK
jgi:NAD+ diphosphatase